MHKSISILMALLLIVSPLMMFGSQFSLFSNAMAYEYEDSGYYDYEADKYEKYNMNMANDYKEKYKSQNVDITKKIKCNNINANFNGIQVGLGTSTNSDLENSGVAGAAAAQADELVSASAFGNGEGYNDGFKKFKNDLDIKCINNNDNSGAGQEGPQGPAENGSVECEECIKYWLILVQEGGAGPLDVINPIANAINNVNFDIDPLDTCEESGDPVNPLPGVECLSIFTFPDLDTTAQLFDICTQLDLALQFLVNQGDTPQQALAQIKGAVLDGTGVSGPPGRVAIGIFNCLEETFLPIAFPEDTN